MVRPRFMKVVGTNPTSTSVLNFYGDTLFSVALGPCVNEELSILEGHYTNATISGGG